MNILSINVPDWKVSKFFEHKNQADYSVFLKTVSSFPLSVDDTEKIINMLSKHTWREKETEPEYPELNSNLVYIYNQVIYRMSITHPNGKSINLGITSGGVERDGYEDPLELAITNADGIWRVV